MAMDRVDVLLLTALKDELSAVLALPGLEATWEPRADENGYRFAVQRFQRENGAPFTVAAARASDMGETAAAAAAMRLIYQLRPSYLGMCGICAGARGEVELGDVIVAERVYKFDGGGVRVQGKANGQQDVTIRHDLRTYNLLPTWRQWAEDMGDEWARTLPAPPPTKEAQQRWLLKQLANGKRQRSAATTIRALGKARREQCPDWPEVVKKLRDDGFLSPRGLALQPKGREAVEEEELLYPDGRPARGPRVHVGAVGTSARVQRDATLFDQLRKLVRKTIGVEMEGAALGMVAEMEIIPAIMVKSVVDFADEQKDDGFREYAAAVAAKFLINFLQKHLPVTNAGGDLAAGMGSGMPVKRERTRARQGKFEWYLLLKVSRQSASRRLNEAALGEMLREATGEKGLYVRARKDDPLLFTVSSTERTYSAFRRALVSNPDATPLLRAVQYVCRAKGSDPDDPNEGKYSRLPRHSGRFLWATVRTVTQGWYEIHLEVRAIDEDKPLTGHVEFFLHPTFPDQHLVVPVRDGKASVDIRAYGSFVVGAVADKGKTKLELDLGGVPRIPKGFIDE